jgi:hypothetical protein
LGFFAVAALGALQDVGAVARRAGIGWRAGAVPVGDDFGGLLALADFQQAH